MTGWKIFSHSARMVSDNLIDAFRISFLLYIVQVAINVWFNGKFGDYLIALHTDPALPAPQGFWMAWSVTMVVVTISGFWIAVGWHRFVLVQEVPGTVLPPLHGNLVVSYLVSSIAIGILIALVAGVGVLVLGFAFSTIAGGAGALLAIITVVGYSVYLFYRWGLVLPSAALGKPMKMKESWDNTVLASGVIWQLAVIAVGMTALVMAPGLLNVDPFSLVNEVYTYVLNWILMMVGISVLTTLYGVYFEGRDL
jgi:hypothetical protein